MMATCRFYQEKFPMIGELVMAKLINKSEVGFHVHLLEYDCLEAMINLDSGLRRAGRHLVATLKIGEIMCVRVIRVVEEKGWIDVSHKGISEEEKEECDLAYKQANCVNQILMCTARRLGLSNSDHIEELLEKTVWYFQGCDSHRKAPYHAFLQAAQGFPILDKCNLDEDTKAVLLMEIKRKLSPNPMKLCAYIDVTCFESEGIDAIKAALKAGKDIGTPSVPIKVVLCNSPTYQISTQTLDRETGQEVINAAITVIQDVIQKAGGWCKLIKQTVSTSQDLLEETSFEEMDISR